MRYLVYVKGAPSGSAHVYEYEANEPISWSGLELETHDHVPQNEAAPLPVSVKVWEPHVFRRLFSIAEQEGILTASKSDVRVENYLRDLDMAPEVRSDDQMVIDALTMLESSGLIAVGRSQEILNG